MTVNELIAWLDEQPDKELQVVVESPIGFCSVCGESGEVELDGETYLLLQPCYGHDGEKLDLELSSDDFEINEN